MIQGFSRVMIDQYEAVSAERAEKRGIRPEVGFLRGDGWSLRTPANLEWAAHQTWKREWTHFTRDLKTWQPISEYR